MINRLPAFIALTLLLLFFYVRLPSNPWNRVIHSDGKGYYAHLPALFIYNDLEYNFADEIEKKYYPSDGSLSKHFRFKFKGETVNKTFSGITLLWLPFFLLAHLITIIIGLPADGYSLIYQLSIGIAAIFYCWIGCRLLLKLLKSFGIPRDVAAITTVLFIFGTNYFYYVLLDPSLTHSYNFTLITALLLFTRRFTIDNKGRDLFLIVAIFAVILWIRPQNGFVAFAMPFVMDSSTNFKAFLTSLFSPLQRTMKLLFIFGFIIFMPMLLWYLQTGYFIVYSYGEEGFNFSNPQFLNVLFSYQKGLFIYTPVILLSLFGLPYLFKKNRFSALWLVFFFLINTYIIASWQEWWYGCSYGHRVFIDFYAINAVLMAVLIAIFYTSTIKKVLISVLLSGFILLNLIQVYQHYHSIVPPCYSSKEIYWKHFLRLTPLAEVEVLPNWKLISSSANDFEKEMSGWEVNPSAVINDETTDGNHIYKLDENSVYGSSYRKLLSPNENRIVVKALLKSSTSDLSPKLILDIHNEQGESVLYRAIEVSPYLRRKKWVQFNWLFEIESPAEGSELLIYFWHPDQPSPFYTDNVEVLTYFD